MITPERDTELASKLVRQISKFINSGKVREEGAEDWVAQQIALSREEDRWTYYAAIEKIRELNDEIAALKGAGK